MYGDGYGIPINTYYLDDNNDEENYPKDFSAEDLFDVNVRNEIYEEVAGIALENELEIKMTFQEAQELLYKVSVGTITTDETIQLLNYIFRKQFERESNNLYGDLIEYDPYGNSEEDSNKTDEDYEDESAKDILDWLDMEEEGKPLPNPFRLTEKEWDDIIADCCPRLPRYYLDCNEAQLKNRIKLDSFLSIVLESRFLHVPPSKQEQEQNRKEAAASEAKFPVSGLDNDVPFDEEVPF